MSDKKNEPKTGATAPAKTPEPKAESASGLRPSVVDATKNAERLELCAVIGADQGLTFVTPGIAVKAKKATVIKVPAHRGPLVTVQQVPGAEGDVPPGRLSVKVLSRRERTEYERKSNEADRGIAIVGDDLHRSCVIDGHFFIEVTSDTPATITGLAMR
jgi:hypothetical protein